MDESKSVIQSETNRKQETEKIKELPIGLIGATNNRNAVKMTFF